MPEIQFLHCGEKDKIPWTVDHLGYEAAILIDASDGTVFRPHSKPPIPPGYIESFGLHDDEGELTLLLTYRTLHDCQDEPSVFDLGKVPIHLRDEAYDFIRSLKEAFGYRVEVD